MERFNEAYIESLSDLQEMYDQDQVIEHYNSLDPKFRGVLEGVLEADTLFMEASNSDGVTVLSEETNIPVYASVLKSAQATLIGEAHDDTAEDDEYDGDPEDEGSADEDERYPQDDSDEAEAEKSGSVSEAYDDNSEDAGYQGDADDEGSADEDELHPQMKPEDDDMEEAYDEDEDDEDEDDEDEDDEEYEESIDPSEYDELVENLQEAVASDSFIIRTDLEEDGWLIKEGSKVYDYIREALAQQLLSVTEAFEDSENGEGFLEALIVEETSGMGIAEAKEKTNKSNSKKRKVAKKATTAASIGAIGAGVEKLTRAKRKMWAAKKAAKKAEKLALKGDVKGTREAGKKIMNIMKKHGKEVGQSKLRRYAIPAALATAGGSYLAAKAIKKRKAKKNESLEESKLESLISEETNKSNSKKRKVAKKATTAASIGAIGAGVEKLTRAKRKMWAAKKAAKKAEKLALKGDVKGTREAGKKIMNIMKKHGKEVGQSKLRRYAIPAALATAGGSYLAAKAIKKRKAKKNESLEESKLRFAKGASDWTRKMAPKIIGKGKQKSKVLSKLLTTKTNKAGNISKVGLSTGSKVGLGTAGVGALAVRRRRKIKKAEKEIKGLKTEAMTRRGKGTAIGGAIGAAIPIPGTAAVGAGIGRGLTALTQSKKSRLSDLKRAAAREKLKGKTRKAAKTYRKAKNYALKKNINFQTGDKNK